MDSAKIGVLIAKLRKEKGLTQKNIADALGVSNKTVSKWECGVGCADLAYWPELSVILGADIAQIMEGEITVNKPDPGNINRIRFYVCPVCGNVLTSTGSAAIFCCGRKTDALEAEEEHEKPLLTAENSDIDYYVTVDHPMSKDHYIAFAAYINNDRFLMQRMYPEQTPAFRIPSIRRGKLYLYCTKHGLSIYKNSELKNLND